MTKPKWILLAEDNPHDADMAIRALAADQSSGCVVLAHDGVEVLNCLYRRGEFQACDAPGNPALVLLDLKMPRVDGLEVLEQIRADPQFRHVPVVVFTSSCERADLMRSYQLGANAFVVKPVDFHRFTAALQELRKFWMIFNEPPPEGLTRARSGTPRLAHAA